MERFEMIERLVRQFNRWHHTRYKHSANETRRLVGHAIDVGGEDGYSVLFSWFADTKYETLPESVGAYISYIRMKKNPSETPAESPEIPTEATETSTPISNPTNSAEQNAGNALGILEQALAEVIVRNQGERIAGEILGNISEKVDSYIRDNYGTIHRKVEITVDDTKVEFGEILHSKFETVLKFVKMNEPVFLTGAAGCGKNVICKQVAKALGIDFYFSNAVTQEYKITGFTDANGTFHETQFYKAFKNGGLFMLDEIDASIPEVLVILNAAIANRYFDFPAPIGYVEAHPDFRVIAAGNTFGLGADYEYVGRNQLDMASLDRFALIPIDYDRNIEMSLAGGDNELVDFADDFREAAKRCGIHCIVSYRAIQRMAKMMQLLDVEEVLKSCLLKNLQTDDINMIHGELKVEGKYKNAIRAIARG